MPACARSSSALLAGLLLSACAAVPGGVADGAICGGAGLSVDVGFAGAGRHDCVVAPDGSLVISVDHEPALEEGINPSPWFAFRIASDAARQVTATLDYTDYKHRYAPYVSADGKTWTQLAPVNVQLNERQTRASLKLDLPKGVTWVAGQPLSPSADNLAWTRALLGPAGYREERYGTSLEGRALIGFVAGDGADAIVALTRQHPPETTGQDAYRGFLERLTGRDDDKARAFRAAHRVIVAPMPNPDGVDGGHWRLNAGGMDLNRDWGKFTQPETKALSAWILKQAEGKRVVSMMDFHSTDRSVIYAPPLDAPSPTIGFLGALKGKLDELPQPPGWSYSHNPDGGTSKGWALERLKAPGLTVELWDRIPPADARGIGAAAADALIEYFAR